jgi:hemerythrin
MLNQPHTSRFNGDHMPLFKWDNNLSIGIRDIDKNNRRLIEFLYDAYDVLAMGFKLYEYYQDEFLEYMKYSFACEEALMTIKLYPDIIEHKSEHELCISELTAICNLLKQAPNRSVKFLLFVNIWINHHIRGTDAKFGNFVQAENNEKR